MRHREEGKKKKTIHQDDEQNQTIEENARDAPIEVGEWVPTISWVYI